MRSSAPSLRASAAMNFVFHNRIHVIAMGVVIVAFWNQYLQLPLDTMAYLTILGSVLFAYLINMYFDEHEDTANAEITPGRVVPRSRNARAMSLSVFTLTWAAAASHDLGYGMLIVVVMLTSGAYSAPLRIGGKTVRIKTLPYVKNLYAALHWSVVLIGLALAYTGTAPTALTLLIVGICFGMNYFVELLWDVRDLNGDRQTRVMTIPNMLGLTASRWLLHATHLAVCALVIGGMQYGLLPRGFMLIYVHLAAMLAFTEYYFRLQDKRLASHLYVLYVCGALTCISLLDAQLR
ncbi:hypothetical protein GJ700_30020 [Duganella sp. FT92W]|uniref:Prenyltransferase n=1 Tax=Pseudoduganella rivuli TaxID=2666085 RepID=A0A7X2ITX4_9BURK|nr:UbiA family prenyltransferase [Pseudoduganella rivuli]MRV75958.1 hypothetical protein [Pseudoduganella rivuli]